MNITITGSSGFVGKNLLEAIPNSIGVSLREDNWQKKIQSADVIINLVGKAHDHGKEATERDFYYANLELTKRIFQAFLSSSACLLIHFSSLAAVEEYEASEPLDEHAVCNPVSWYGKSKRAAENWLLDQTLSDGKKLIIIRPPMIHGPGDKGNLGLLYKFIDKGLPYPLAAFKNNRSFISIYNLDFFVQKVIDGYLKLPSGIYHVADDEPLSTSEMIKVMANVRGKKVRKIEVPKMIIYYIARIGDIIPIPLNSTRLKKMTSDLLVSNKKIKRLLDIQKLPLSAEEGLIKTLVGFKTEH